METRAIEHSQEKLVNLEVYPINCLQIENYQNSVVNQFFSEIKQQSHLYGVQLKCRYFEATFETKEFWGFLVTSKGAKPIALYPQQQISRKREQFIYSKLMRLIKSEYHRGLN
jgi:hypothetical protein